MTARTLACLLLVAAPAAAQDVTVETGGAADPSTRLTDAAEKLEESAGRARLRATPRATSLFAMMVQRFGSDNAAWLFVTPAQDARVCRTPVANPTRPGLEASLALCLHALTQAVKAGKIAPGGPRTAAPATPARPLPPSKPGAHQANWAQVAGVYFQVSYISGVGGMIVPDYEPVVLFKDGSYYEPDETPIEDLDLAASRSAEPRSWGRWTGGGTSFTLTAAGPRAKPQTYKLQDGSFFKAFPAEALNRKLSATYSRVGGGGNTALGGDIMVGGRTDIAFAPDGSFGRDSGGGGMAPGVATSSRRRYPGAYEIAAHRITMTGADGTPQRRFFAVGSQGKTPRPDPEMIFIGDTVYTILNGR